MLALTLLTLPLAGCETAVFDARACPTERVYTKAQQDAIAAEYVKSGPAIKGAIVDYGKLRDKARACRGAKE